METLELRYLEGNYTPFEPCPAEPTQLECGVHLQVCNDIYIRTFLLKCDNNAFMIS